MSAKQQQQKPASSADTDLFFIIESVTIFVEKLIDVLEEPLLKYSKSEWSKFKDLLTSSNLNPCSCFSYANALRLSRPATAAAVASQATQSAHIPVASFDINNFASSPSIMCFVANSSSTLSAEVLTNHSSYNPHLSIASTTPNIFQQSS